MTLTNKIPTWIIHATIIIGGAILTFGSAASARKFFEKQSIKAFVPLDSIYHLNKSMANQHSVLTEKQADIVSSKAEIIEQRKDHHKSIFMKIYSNHYAAVTVFPFLSGITVILSFLIAQKGWSLCSPRLKTTFLTFALLTALYGIFPTVYKQTETINNNLDNYLELNAVQNKLFDYCLTAPVLYGDSLTFNDFINQVNKEEHDIENIFFGLEHKSIDDEILNHIN